MFLIQNLGKKKDDESQYLVFSYDDDEMTIIDKGDDLAELSSKYEPHKLVDEYFVAELDLEILH